MATTGRRVWTLFAACALLVLLGLSLLSTQAWQLDAERRVAQQRSVHEEQVRLALWRLDSALSPLLVRESGRTHQQFVRPTGEALPDEVRLRFAANMQGARVLAPRASEEARKQFGEKVSATWLDAQVPKPNSALAASALPRGQGSDGLRIEDRQGHAQGVVGNDDLQQKQNAAAQQLAEKSLLLPEQQTVAYQSNVSDNEFQRRLGNVQKSSPGYGGSANYRQNSDWEWNGARQGEVDRVRPVSENERKVDKLDKTQGAGGLDDGAGFGSSSRSSDTKLSASVRKRGAKIDDVLADVRDKNEQPLLVREAVMAALWQEDMLLLARRAEAEDGQWIEGTWLDWPSLEKLLLDEIRDLLPAAQLEPVRASPEDTTRLLATIPVRLVPGPLPNIEADTWTAMRVAIFAAWIVALIVALASFFLLRATLSLSERRGAFVSAVTHELRTPLTTFRMYTEMLADGMVQDPARRRDYIETLRSEAHRLDNLVQNVLSYARIEDERAKQKGEQMSCEELVRGVVPRLRERCTQAGASFEVHGLDDLAGAQLEVDPTAAEQILFNLVDNAAKYGRGEGEHKVELELELRASQLALRVRDHGHGIQASEAQRIFRAFEKAEAHAAGTLPGVGLGLALCKGLARQLGGRLRLLPSSGKGACFELTLPRAR